MSKIKPRAPREVGLYASSYPKPLRQYVDYDYLDKLSPEERAELAEFTNRYYGADFRDADDETWDRESRLERYRAKNAANRDAYSIAQVSGRVNEDDKEVLVEPDPWAERDWVEWQGSDYLNSQDYKKALAEFRSHLPSDPRRKVKETTRFKKSKRQLSSIKKGSK